MNFIQPGESPLLFFKSMVYLDQYFNQAFFIGFEAKAEGNKLKA